MTKLTEHFTLEEFTASQTAARKGIANAPGPNEKAGIQRTAETMEKVRSLLGSKPILISSGYRSPALNKAIGGSKTSKHISGLAVDFTCPGFGTPLSICKELRSHLESLAVDQLIHEYDSWVHLGLTAGKPRHQVLTINSDGTRTGL